MDTPVRFSSSFCASLSRGLGKDGGALFNGDERRNGGDGDGGGCVGFELVGCRCGNVDVGDGGGGGGEGGGPPLLARPSGGLQPWILLLPSPVYRPLRWKGKVPLAEPLLLLLPLALPTIPFSSLAVPLEATGTATGYGIEIPGEESPPERLADDEVAALASSSPLEFHRPSRLLPLPLPGHVSSRGTPRCSKAASLLWPLTRSSVAFQEDSPRGRLG